MASLSTCHLGLWLGWQILLNLVKSLCNDRRFLNVVCGSAGGDMLSGATVGEFGSAPVTTLLPAAGTALPLAGITRNAVLCLCYCR